MYEDFSACRLKRRATKAYIGFKTSAEVLYPLSAS